ncbi:putative uncharacterized protein [Acetobacter sp. CAG:977]|nr:putative uncharacterized protein [Acetobacter sp. CAG:977]
MAELLKEYEDFLKNYEAEKQADPLKREEIDQKYARMNSDFFAVAQKEPYDRDVLKRFHQEYYGVPEQKNMKDVLASKDQTEWSSEEILLNNKVSKFQLTEDPASVNKDSFLEQGDYTDKEKREMTFMLNGELSRVQPDAAFVSFDDIMKESQEAVNNPDYASDGGFLQRYEHDVATAASDEDAEEIRRNYYKENPSFYLAAQKREFDGALLDMARSEYYEDVPAVEGKKNEIAAKTQNGEELTEEEKNLVNMVEKYGLEEDFENRNNDKPVDLNDYPKEDREEYAARMNAMLRRYVPNYQQKSVQDFCDAADLAEGRANSAETDQENEEEIDLLKEAEEMKRWLGYYDEEGRASSPDFKMPYSMITGISQKDPKDPNCPVDISLETGTTLQTRQKNIAMKYPDASGPSLEDCMTMVRMGQKRGWTVANLKGSENFKRQMFLACTMLGMEVKGYQPSPELKKQAEQMLLAQQEKKKQTGQPTLRETALDLDARTVNGSYVPPSPPKQEKEATQEQTDDKQPKEGEKQAEKEGDKPKENKDEKSVTLPPLTEEEKKQVQERFDTVDKITSDCMKDVMSRKNAAEKQASIDATLEQRKRIRAALIEAERKEAAGEALTPADEKAKKMAEQYKVSSNPKDKPEKIPLINPKHLDKDLKQKRETAVLDARAGALLEISAIQSTAVTCKQMALDPDKEKASLPVTPEVMKSQIEAQVSSQKAMMSSLSGLGGNSGEGQKPSHSQILQKVGENNSMTKYAQADLESKCAARGMTAPQRGMDASMQKKVSTILQQVQKGAGRS